MIHPHDVKILCSNDCCSYKKKYRWTQNHVLLITFLYQNSIQHRDRCRRIKSGEVICTFFYTICYKCVSAVYNTLSATRTKHEDSEKSWGKIAFLYSLTIHLGHDSWTVPLVLGYICINHEIEKMVYISAKKSLNASTLKIKMTTTKHLDVDSNTFLHMWTSIPIQFVFSM